MTALEYLEDWMEENLIIIGVDFEQALIKAKEMEKQQIIEAHGDKKRVRTSPGGFIPVEEWYKGEQYYNDKFLTPKKK
jgi:hypothetical protein